MAKYIQSFVGFAVFGGIILFSGGFLFPGGTAGFVSLFNGFGLKLS